MLDAGKQDEITINGVTYVRKAEGKTKAEKLAEELGKESRFHFASGSYDISPLGKPIVIGDEVTATFKVL